MLRTKGIDSWILLGTAVEIESRFSSGWYHTLRTYGAALMSKRSNQKTPRSNTAWEVEQEGRQRPICHSLRKTLNSPCKSFKLSRLPSLALMEKVAF